MENRRQTYRHPFPPTEVLRVELQVPEGQPPLTAELIDLSLGGMRVRLPPASDRLREGEVIGARLVGRAGPVPVELDLTLRSRVVYLHAAEEGAYGGMHFLPAANAAANEKTERVLGRFLMAEQRRTVRRGGANPPASSGG
jgi:c-di-GMP-binding flagellar brake protein YcgR